MGDEDIMYKPLLDNVDVETLINESDFKIDTGSLDRLQGIEQENPVVKDEGKLAAQGRPGPQGKSR